LLLATAALGALVWSLLTGNFALAYVADTTTRQGNWYYRLAGLWGGNGGSLLLWGWIILMAGAWTWRRRAAAGLVVTGVGGAVLLIAATAANPFQKLQIPAIDGGGLNPILQYPAMLYHPLVLYAGHAGLAAPFALAVVGLMTGRRDRAWWSAIRRATMVAWLLLGIGLIAGARWSYVELGWGGFWGWDPVENSGLLPWLAATAFLHAARRSTIDRERQAPVGVVVLAAIPFCFSLLGAALSRSGAAQSVHAFADARAVGWGLLMLFLVALAVLVVAVARATRVAPSRPALVRRRLESVALGAGVVVLLATAAVVAFGTLYPVFDRLVSGQTITVTARYYATVVTPLVVIGAALMGVAPSLGSLLGARRPLADSGSTPDGGQVAGGGPVARSGRWARLRTVIAAGRSRWLLAAVAAAIAAALMAPNWASACLGSAAAAAAVLTVAELVSTRRLRRAGTLVAHLGAALLLFGIGASLLGHEDTQVVALGSVVHVDGFSLRYQTITLDRGSNWQRARTVLVVTRRGTTVAVLRPGLQVFTDQTAALSQVAIHSTPGEDLIVAVQSIDPATSAADLVVTVRPLVSLVWWGGLLVAIGGGLVLWTTLSAPRRRRDRKASVASPAPVDDDLASRPVAAAAVSGAVDYV
jgi:cytochrome c-type biogenesis protein CcmF